MDDAPSQSLNQDNHTFLYSSPIAICGLAEGCYRRERTTTFLGMINVVFDIFAFAGFVIFWQAIVIFAWLILLAARSDVGQQRDQQNYEDASPHLWLISAGLGRYVVNVDQLCCWLSFSFSQYQFLRAFSLIYTADDIPDGNFQLQTNGEGALFYKQLIIQVRKPCHYYVITCGKWPK